MKFYNYALTGVASLLAATLVEGAVQGFDISHYQATVNFAQAYADGARFVIIKVCEIEPSFDYD
jgi:GH25 family lysozyme M1 (1,4-beta-N-acetylmuramidase)